MKIKFFGHASFLLSSSSGVKIITDPYKPGCFDGGIKYDPITEEADIVTISHEHDDHNETNINGNPVYIREAKAQDVKDISFSGFEVFHDTSGGNDRGSNIVYKMVIDGLNVVHCGDLGHDLSPEMIGKIGDVDVLLVPTGGHFTIDASGADGVVDALKPRVVIPMHYKTEKCGFPIAPVDDFTQGKEVKRIEGEYELTGDTLPADRMYVVLEPSK